MIPVRPAPEPASFDKRVRAPGNQFLLTHPRPSDTEWHKGSYWKKVLPELQTAYHQTCAYCASRIAHSTGVATVDHFLPKSKHPQLAYEWSNYRYVSTRFNSRKRDRQILDPFVVEYGWFVLDFATFFVSPGNELDEPMWAKIYNTINILGLNSDYELVTERQVWYEGFRRGEYPFAHLQKERPFIASEALRQGLVGFGT